MGFILLAKGEGKSSSAVYLFPLPWAILLGVLVTLLTGVYSLKTLSALIPLECSSPELPLSSAGSCA